MNTPNKLTILRIGLSFVCIGLILKNSLIDFDRLYKVCTL